jgi:hypothetical protein
MTQDADRLSQTLRLRRRQMARQVLRLPSSRRCWSATRRQRSVASNRRVHGVGPITFIEIADQVVDLS